MKYILLAALTAFGISAWLTRSFCNPASRFHILDHPNERSLHSRPTPRTGGVAVVVAIMVALTLLTVWEGMSRSILWISLSMLIVAAISFVDDRRGLSVQVRLFGHLTSSVILVATGTILSSASLPGTMWIWPVWIATGFSLMYLIWMINLYNFMDGMDGLAGGMAVIGFGTFAVLGFLAGNPLFAALTMVIATAAGGFLVFNFPPARIFIGDTGSSMLGLLAGAMTLWAARDGIFPFWTGLLVFSPFLVDATVTLFRRLLRGERVWVAHKTHYYQRLVQLGWSHRKTVLAEYSLMLACSVSAVTIRYLDEAWQGGLLVAWCLAYIGLMTGVTRLEKRLMHP